MKLQVPEARDEQAWVEDADRLGGELHHEASGKGSDTCNAVMFEVHVAVVDHPECGDCVALALDSIDVEPVCDLALLGHQPLRTVLYRSCFDTADVYHGRCAGRAEQLAAEQLHAVECRHLGKHSSARLREERQVNLARPHTHVTPERPADAELIPACCHLAQSDRGKYVVSAPEVGPPIRSRQPDQRPEAAPAPRALGEGCLQVEVAADLDLAYIRVCGRVLCGHGCRPVDARAMDDQVNSATLFDPLGDSAKLGRVANIGAVVSRPAAAVVGFELGY